MYGTLTSGDGDGDGAIAIAPGQSAGMPWRHIMWRQQAIVLAPSSTEPTQHQTLTVKEHDTVIAGIGDEDPSVFAVR